MPHSSEAFGMQRQLAIYMAGMQNELPRLPVSFGALERQAEAKMRPEAFAYVAGSAGSETTAAANCAAFERVRIVPRVMRDVSGRELGVELFGRRLDFPVLLAPIGVLGIVHPDAELAVVRAASALRVAMILSTVSSRPIEAVAEAGADSPRWFQLYWGSDREVTASMVRRAEAAGFEALVVTLDTKLLAWRNRDIQRAYLPFLHGDGLANYFSDPAFRAALDEPPEVNPRKAIALFAQIFSNPTVTWRDLEWLRGVSRLPIVVKGILHPDDARAAMDHGVDGMIVSNHGGRQVDGAIAALECLPQVTRAVDDRVPVLFDSGVRGGADVFKALALGARAVLLGRPYVYALALGGAEGVREMVHNLLAEFDLTLALSGCRTVAEIGTDNVRMTTLE